MMEGDTVPDDAVPGGDVRGNVVSKQQAGRKAKHESRAEEFRQALVIWQQTPESMRPSLRALAKELRTSHALLQHYLETLAEWQCQERYRVAKARVDKKAEEIRARVEAEGRGMTMREYGDAFIVPGFVGKIEELRQEAKRGPLHSGWFRLLERFAKRGSPEMQELAQELLARRSQIGVKARKTFTAIVQATPRLEGEMLRPFRCKDEAYMIRRFVFQWFTCQGYKPSGRSWAKQLGISNAWLVKLCHEFAFAVPLPSASSRFRRIEYARM